MADLLENLDVRLQEFSKSVLQKIIKKYGVKKTDLILRMSKKVSGSSLNSTAAHWAAYFYRYGPCYTSALVNELSKMVIRDPTIFGDILWKGKIQICCLGGNMALEAVALSLVVQSVQDQFWVSSGKPLHLKITAMDKNRHWKDTALDVIETLAESKDMLDASKTTVSFEFVRANLSKPLENDAVEALREADIVTMVYPIIPSKEMSPLIQNISLKMKEDAIFFYMNTGINMQWSVVEKSLRAFNCIYGQSQVEAFTLSPSSIQRCISLFWHDYSNICTTSCIINSCAWIKTTDATSEVSRHSGRRGLRIAKQRWHQKKEESQRILEEFHSEVHAIVPKRVPKKKDLKEGSLLTGGSQKMCKKNILFPSRGKDKRISL